MAASGSKSLATIGFLTVREYAERGLFGGYLILSTAGRPLEFHCTAPVRPSRAQEILYGPTLQPFLYGEQIGGTLVSKGVSRPLLVCTDVAPVLATRENSDIPMVLVLDQRRGRGEDAGADLSYRVDISHTSIPSPALMRFALGRNEVAVPRDHASDRDAVERAWQKRLEDLDLWEPFTRIHEAIEETQRGSGRGT